MFLTLVLPINQLFCNFYENMILWVDSKNNLEVETGYVCK